MPIQILSNIQVRNNHVHVIFSSIGKIVNCTKIPLLILKTNSNDPQLYERIEKLDVDDEYYIPINFMHEYFHSSILIGPDQ